MKIETNYFGKDGFQWWIGVVEDRRDPMKLGRLRTRILGAHTEIKQFIPTCELWWCYVYQPITWNQAMNGLGHSPTGPAEGTWVWGFYKDNESAQDPIILGTIHGIPEEPPNPCLGFYDPGVPFHDIPNAPRKIKSRYYPNDGSGAQLEAESSASLYPRETHPWGCVIGENDVNRLARAEKVDDTIIGVRKRQRDVGRPGEFGAVPIAFVHKAPQRKWVEQLPRYGAEYPYNHVFESESGHIFEIDDTPGAGRFHYYHPSGTYVEISNEIDGDFKMKVVGKRFETTMENAYSHYQNCLNVTVDGEVNVYCRSDANVQVDGNLKVHVQGNYEEKVHGNYTTDIDGNRIVKIGGYEEVNIKGNQTTNLGSNHSVNVVSNQTTSVGGSDTLNVKGDQTTLVGGKSERDSGGAMNDIAGGSIKQSAGGTFRMASGGELSGDGSSVYFNSGHGSTSSPSSPGSPASPAPPIVPPFPAPLGFVESRSESGPDPSPENKGDPSPKSCDQKDC